MRTTQDAARYPIEGEADRAAVALSYTEQTDAQLVHRLAQGDADALSELYDRHASGLLGAARRILRNRDDAEEVLQESFLHAWNRAETYDTRRSSVVTWLSLILRSRAIDRLRTLRSRDRTLATIQQQDPPSFAPSEARRTVLAGERRQRLTSAMGRLPHEQREVLEMSFYQELSHSQIAERTGVPLGTVKTRTVLGMKKLRRALHHEVAYLM